MRIKKIVVGFVFSTALLIVFIFLGRFYIWSASRPIGIYAVCNSLTLHGLPKDQVKASLGTPDFVDGPYGILHIDEKTRVVFHLDVKNVVRKIRFGSIIQTKTMRKFDKLEWKNADTPERIEMVQDLISKYQSNGVDWPTSYADLKGVFSEIVFSDRYTYRIGSGRNLAIDFDEGGSVSNFNFKYE